MQNTENLTLSGWKCLRRPAVDPDNFKATLVILHGYGADEYDLMGLAPYFDAGLQILSVRGPGSTPYGGASWFGIDQDLNGSLKFNVDQALENAAGIVRLIGELKQQSIISEDRLILGGFSQGATIAQLVTLQRPVLIKALLIMSGRLTDQAIGLLDDPVTLTGLPVFTGHGTHDNVIPLGFGRQIVSFWKALPVTLTHHEYPMGHEICQEELGHMQEWMRTFS